MTVDDAHHGINIPEDRVRLGRVNMHAAAQHLLVEDDADGLKAFVQAHDVVGAPGQFSARADHAVRLHGAGNIQERPVLPQLLFEGRALLRRVFREKARGIGVLRVHHCPGLLTLRIL